MAPTPDLFFRWFGAPQASAQQVIVYLHGFPGSHLEAELLQGDAAKRNLAILAIDRPGFGESVQFAGRTIASFPDQLLHLLSSLAVQRFSILAVSGGAPYAIACAAALGERVDKTLILSGLGEIAVGGLLEHMVWQNRAILTAARYAPITLRPFLATMVQRWRTHPAGMIRALAKTLNMPDKEILLRRELMPKLTANMLRGLTQGVRGPYEELKLLTRKFRLDYRAISNPVLLWHGDDDRYVPESHSHYYHAQIPYSQLKIWAGRGHFMAVDMTGEALDALLG